MIDNTENNFSIKMSETYVPIYKEVYDNRGNYYLAGPDNKWFFELQELYYGSSIHGAILNNLHQRINDGIEDDLISKVSLDYIVYGGFSVEVMWNLDHTKILKINYLDYSKIRSGKPDNTDKVSFYYYSNDWGKYSYRDIDMVQAYNDNPVSDNHQIYCYKRYILGDDIYPKPYYVGGLKWIVTDIQLENYYSNLVSNNFVANKILSINQYYDEERQSQLLKGIKKNFTGTDPAGSILVMFSEDKEHSPTIESFNNEADDQKYRFLTEQITQQISISHNLPIQLLGVLVPGKLGSSTELPVFEGIYSKYVVDPLKKEIIKGLTPLYKNRLDMATLPEITKPIEKKPIENE